MPRELIRGDSLSWAGNICLTTIDGERVQRPPSFAAYKSDKSGEEYLQDPMSGWQWSNLESDVHVYNRNATLR